MTGVPDCVFCGIVRREIPAFVVYESPIYLAFLDKYPRSPGHMQLIPKEHYRYVYDIPDMSEIFGVAQKIIRVIIPLLGASHVTLGAFGHEVHHAHIWIVPQYGQRIDMAEGRKGGGSIDQAPLAEKLRIKIAKEV